MKEHNEDYMPIIQAFKFKQKELMQTRQWLNGDVHSLIVIRKEISLNSMASAHYTLSPKIPYPRTRKQKMKKYYNSFYI